MSKTLSTGTLNLRFMQNAKLVKEQKEAELRRSAIKDESEWEVSREVRDSWKVPVQPNQNVIQESSYLPFLFPSLQATDDDIPSGSRPRGRRVFKKGREIEQTTELGPEPSPATPVDVDPKTLRMSAASRPIAKLRSNGSVPSKQSKGKETAQQTVFSSSGVGADMRQVKAEPVEATQTAPQPPAPPKFMKPAGVDEPAELSRRSAVPKVKREHSDTNDGRPKKRKKSKD